MFAHCPLSSIKKVIFNLDISFHLNEWQYISLESGQELFENTDSILDYPPDQLNQSLQDWAWA